MKQTNSEPAIEIRAVVFDWGGVIIEHPVGAILEFVKTYLPDLAYDGADGSAMRAFQKGAISEQEFWKQVGAPGSLDLNAFEGSLWRKGFEYAYREHGPVVRLAAVLQEQGYLTAMLSNTEKPSVAMFLDKKYTCFDHTYFSCEWGLVKPDADIYERCSEALGLPPEQILFIDDKIENIESARAVGMKAHLMRDYAGLDACLRRLHLPRLEYE